MTIDTEKKKKLSHSLKFSITFLALDEKLN